MKRTHKGFTLVELLIVVAIIGVLGASMSLSAKDATPKAQAARLVSDFKLIRTAVVLYHIDSSDQGPTLAYFKAHSNDYLAGKLSNFSIAEANNQWTATYTGPLSVAANEALTDSKDLDITKSEGTIGTGNVKLQMRVY